MINEWQPTAAIDISVLKSLVPYGQEALQQPIQLNKVVSKDLQKKVQGWIMLPEKEWQNTIAALATEELFPLAAFFTLAENQLGGLQCGASNPAIWIFRWLRSHKLLPDKDQIRQLKQLTDNRFIPYGSVL